MPIHTDAAYGGQGVTIESANLRMETAEYHLERTEGGQRLSFPVQLTTLNEMVAARCGSIPPTSRSRRVWIFWPH
jgi:hypothetical protein